MSMLLTPGLYRQPALPVRATGPLARSDVAVLVGYATRGPVGVPVRVESPAAFEALFGPRLAHGFLWPAVKGFFENGGAAAYALRVADDSSAASASVGAWTARASFPWPMIDPRRLRGAAQAAAAAWVQVFEAQLRQQGARSPDPGSWGNGLNLEIRRSSRAVTETRIDAGLDPLSLSLASLSGIEAASVLELTQLTREGQPVTRHVQPRSVDPARRTLQLKQSVASLTLDASRPIQVTSVEFRVDIRSDGRLEQSFDGLAPDPAHSRALVATLAREARSLHLEAPSGARWSDTSSWPPEGDYLLRGGRDGLSEINASHWLSFLPAIARLSEPALIAAPDLVLPDLLPGAEPAPIPDVRDCNVLSAPPQGRLQGRVTSDDREGEPGSGQPQAGAVVDVTGAGGQAITDADGNFGVREILLGLVTVRISKPGFESLELIVQSSAFDTAPLPFELQRLSRPRALAELEVLEVAQALAEPALVGPYKIAIIDPPAASTRLDDLRSWRSRLGDSARLGLFGPWLRVAGPAASGGELASVPASGHVCGAYAAAELEAGVHVSGANRPLRSVEGLTLAIDDAEQGLLNPVGINAIRAFAGRGIRANGARTL
jgi:hypothetical protein